MFRLKTRVPGGMALQPAAFLCLATLAGPAPGPQGQEPAPRSIAPNSDAAQVRAKSDPLLAQEESEALELAIRSSSGNPQALIKNLEDFLARFPHSGRREQVLRTIFRQALQANDPQTATTYAEKLLELEPADPSLLSTLVDLLEQRHDPGSRERALQYTTRFIERVEQLTGKPEVPAEKWTEVKALMRASGYMLRGQVYAEFGETEKAAADYEESYAAYPTSKVAERLGDLAARRDETDRAIDYYATAFAFPETKPEPEHKDQLRKKLGSVYLAKYQSEKGLGELVLARYDELMRTLHSRFKVEGAPNANLRDPFDYVLRRVDGSELRLGEARNKVVVMDFWATWCGPCRLEGKLFERARENFRKDPMALFLAVNVDDDRTGVPAFVLREEWTVPVVYAQGLDQLLGVSALPTVVIFDRQGRVVFRLEGLDPGSFVETLDRKVREALRSSSAQSATSGSHE